MNAEMDVLKFKLLPLGNLLNMLRVRLGVEIPTLAQSAVIVISSLAKLLPINQARRKVGSTGGEGTHQRNGLDGAKRGNSRSSEGQGKNSIHNRSISSTKSTNRKTKCKD